MVCAVVWYVARLVYWTRLLCWLRHPTAQLSTRATTARSNYCTVRYSCQSFCVILLFSNNVTEFRARLNCKSLRRQIGSWRALPTVELTPATATRTTQSLAGSKVVFHLCNSTWIILLKADISAAVRSRRCTGCKFFCEVILFSQHFSAAVPVCTQSQQGNRYSVAFQFKTTVYALYYKLYALGHACYHLAADDLHQQGDSCYTAATSNHPGRPKPQTESWILCRRSDKRCMRLQSV